MINKVIKEVFNRIISLNGFLALISGQIINAICIYISVLAKNARFSGINEADIWGNVLFPRIAANSYIGTFCEFNLIYYYILGITLILLFDVRKSSHSKEMSLSQNKNSIAYIFFSRFMYGFLLVLITLEINTILTLLFIPNINPEKISWEYIYARSEFMMNLYQNHSVIYITICNIEIALFCGLVSNYTIIFCLVKRKIEIITRFLIAGMVLAYSLISYRAPELNIFFAFDPANRYDQGDKCWLILSVMFAIDLIFFVVKRRSALNNTNEL